MNSVHDRSWEQTFSDMVYWKWHGEPRPLTRPPLKTRPWSSA